MKLCYKDYPTRRVKSKSPIPLEKGKVKHLSFLDINEKTS